VQPEMLAVRTRELAEALKANSPQSLAATKRLLAGQNKALLDEAIAAALAANAEARSTHDFREGVASFLEKRKPVWGE
jgi:methylglutaconyl-CoA hydratase